MNFGIIGAAGYIAKRHLKAIKDNNCNLVAAYDPFDSIGILDSFFPDAYYFNEMELFDRYVSKVSSSNQGLNYLSICSPNYLHDSHIRFGLKNNLNVICEKPIVLNPWNLEELINIENKTDRKAYTILQLRLHDAIIKLKEKVGQQNKIYDIDLTYITSRGNWYYTSWKGDERKSGGLATNIGVHFYDMLTWIFGKVKRNVVHIKEYDRVSGFLELENANVRYFLSINSNHLPSNFTKGEKMTYRSIKIDGEEFEFSEGFTELHTKSYKEILDGNGFRISEALECIKIVSDIRSSNPIGLKGDYHPLAISETSKHPFGW